jgi:hypothetical protein
LAAAATLEEEEEEDFFWQQQLLLLRRRSIGAAVATALEEEEGSDCISRKLPIHSLFFNNLASFSVTISTCVLSFMELACK